MPFYTRLGTIPKKRHTQFRRPDGALYSEELFGTEGFVGPTSTMYHIHPPTQVDGWTGLYETKPDYVEQGTMRMRHLLTTKMPAKGDAVTGRIVLLGNSDVEFGICNPAEQMSYHFKNGQGDECLFVHYGSGVCRTMFGTLKFGPKDYLVIPKGTIYQMIFDELADEDRPMDHSKEEMPFGKFLVIETCNASHIAPPPGYMSKKTAQFLEHAPYCERDIVTPSSTDEYPMTVDELGDFEVRIKALNTVHPSHPTTSSGW